MRENQAAFQNLEAERALLGSVLLDNSALYLALDRVSEDDFFSQANRLVFATMCRVKGAGHDVDLVTLCEEFGKRGEIEKAGGATYLATLTDGVPVGTSVAVSEYARIVREKSVMRRLSVAGQNIVARCAEGVGTPTELVEAAQAQLFDVATAAAMKGGGLRPIAEIVAETLPVLERTCGQGVIMGADTGYPSVNTLTAGWQPGELVILAARPSMGKSALALDFARKACGKGRAVGIFALEMSASSMLLRLACRISRIDSNRVRFGRLSDDEVGWLMRALNEIAQWPLWIDDTPGLSIEQIQWRARSFAQQADVKLVIVDHIQLVHSQGENRTQEITRVTGGLQKAARELGKMTKGTLLALSQLNRLAPGDEPQLHHLRESGSIEQDADVVLFLFDRDKKPDPHSNEPHERILKVGKQRNGPTGICPLVWVPGRVGFEEEQWLQEEKAKHA